MNTERNPQTFLEVPGLCSSIMKIPRHPVAPLSEFHDQLVAAKSKAQVIDVLCKRASQHGWQQTRLDEELRNYFTHIRRFKLQF